MGLCWVLRGGLEEGLFLEWGEWGVGRCGCDAFGFFSFSFSSGC